MGNGEVDRHPWWGSMGKLKVFCPFSYKKWQKVKDLNENLSPCLRQTGSRSHDQPVLVNGWRPPGPPIARFATASLSKAKLKC